MPRVHAVRVPNAVPVAGAARADGRRGGGRVRRAAAVPARAGAVGAARQRARARPPALRVRRRHAATRHRLRQVGQTFKNPFYFVLFGLCI